MSYTGLTIAGVIALAAATGPAPWSSDSALLSFFRDHNGAAQANAFFLLGSAIPFAVATAVSTTRLRTLGLDVPGRIIAQVGGTLAAAMLAIAGLATYAITRPHVADSPDAVRALYGIAFAAGGPAFVAFSGLLIAGVSVVGLIGRVLPRAVGWFGVVVAVASELASLSIVSESFNPLLPVGRFGGIAWLIAIGLTLPSTRQQLRDR